MEEELAVADGDVGMLRPIKKLLEVVVGQDIDGVFTVDITKSKIPRNYLMRCTEKFVQFF